MKSKLDYMQHSLPVDFDENNNNNSKLNRHHLGLTPKHAILN